MSQEKNKVERNTLYGLKKYEIDVDQARGMIENNKHNNITTTYYLFLKKFLREGGQPDYSGEKELEETLSSSHSNSNNNLVKSQSNSNSNIALKS